MKKVLSVIIILIILFLVGGVCFKLGFSAGEKSMESVANQYKKVIDYYFRQPKEVFSLNGKVVEIKDNILTIETTVQNPYVLPEEWKTKTVKVIVTNETDIGRWEIKEGKPLRIKLGLSDIKINTQISVSAKENIKDKTEFEAKSIELMPTPPAPPTP